MQLYDRLESQQSSGKENEIITQLHILP